MISWNIVVAQESYKKVEDLQGKWLVYDHEQNRYAPYILVKDSSPRSISIIINKDVAEDYLVLEIPKYTSVYFNDKMECSFDQDTVLVYKISELRKQIKEKIFDPFYTTKRGQGGTGLGLHLIYNIITQQLEGSIQCQSELENYTTFNIKLPKSIH